MNLTQGLHRALACQPQATATVFGERRRTFAQFGDRVARLAGALQAMGLQPGDRIGMLSLNSDRYLEYYMAVPWAGCAVNPVNIRWAAAEIAYSLDDCDTRVLIVDDTFASQVPELRRLSKSLQTVIHAGDAATPRDMVSYESLIADTLPVPDAMRAGADLAGVFYTGGTTGFPKGVMLGHDGLALNGLIMVAEGAVREGTAGLHALPMFHIADVLLMNALWTVGGLHVVLPSFTPAGVLQTIQQHRITSALLVPTAVQATVDHPDVAKFDLSSLEVLAYGGSPISEAVIERTLHALPGVALLQVYGMTELSPAATILRPELHTSEGRALGKVRSGGRPTYCMEVRIVDPNDNEVPRGQVGEIAVRSPAVMLGYWDKPEATQPGAAERMDAYRRRRSHGRGRFCVCRGSPQRHDRHWRRERVLGRGRTGPGATSSGRCMCGDRSTRCAVG